MKKVFKVLLTVLILLAVAFFVYVLIEKPFKKVTFSSLSEMLCDAVGVESEDPSRELLTLGVVSKNIEARENEKLTNEEAYSIISRMYLLYSDDDKLFSDIKDSDKISTAFKKDIAGLLKDGYLEKGGALKPKALANAKKIAEIVSSIRGTDVTQEGSCYGDAEAEGNLSIKSSGVTLSNTTFLGDIILCDTPSASISLSNVTVKGKVIVRAAKNTKLTLLDGTKVVGGVYVVSSTGEATVEGDETVAFDVVSNGKVSVSGNADTVTVLDNADITTNGTIGIVKTDGAGTISIENGRFDTVYARSQGANIRIGQGVTGEKIAVSDGFSGSTVTVSGNIETISCKATNSVINIKGTAVLGTLEVLEKSEKTTVLIEKRAVIENLSNAENSGATVIDNRSQWDGRR